MVLLKQVIGSSPFLILAVFLLIVGFGNLLFNLFRTTRRGNKRILRTGKQNWVNRNATKFFIISLIAILAGIIFFIVWLGKINKE